MTTTSPKRKGSKKTAAAKRNVKPASTTSGSSILKPTTPRGATPLPPPQHVLLLDNGGDTIKYGWLKNKKNDNADNSSPMGSLPNLTARLPAQWTVLAGDQVFREIQNPHSVVSVTRSTERGILTNAGNQLQVWKRLLDVLGVAVPTDTPTATAFGWKQQKAAASNHTEQPKIIPASACAVLITVPPHCPRCVLDTITSLWLDDLGFQRVGLVTAGVAAAYAPSPTTSEPQVLPTQCIVDVGWSATTVVPTYKRRVPDAPQANSGYCIRRMPLAGRHLLRLLQYYCSYRQWNFMGPAAEHWILRHVLEETCFVSLDLSADLKIARQRPPGRRPYDIEYILPDFQTTFKGHVVVPKGLQKLQEEEEEAENEEEDDDEEDESVREEDMNEEDVELDVGDDAPVEEPPRKRKRTSKKGSSNDDNDKDSDEDEDEGDSGEDDDENVEVLRQQLLQQREEEERRRRAMEAERQALRLSVERFTIPEVMFRPSDAGLPREWAGLAETVQQAIQASPAHLQAALYQSIRLVGGFAQLSNLKERLEQELRSLVPCEYELKITMSESPQEDTWRGLKALAESAPHSEWSISKEEWIASGKRGAWQRLTHAEGGTLV